MRLFTGFRCGLAALCGTALLLGCAAVAPSVPTPQDPAARLAWIDRLSWGLGPGTVAEVEHAGAGRWLDAQLRAAPPGPLPAAAQQQVDAMSIGSGPPGALAIRLEQQRRAADALTDVEARQVARQAYQKAMNEAGRETQQRFLLRALYGPDQLREVLSWFWANHFYVSVRKGPVRPLLAEFEDRAIRPHALGRFRDLLGAVELDPAMLVYLDNQQNAAGRINENLARELMELHTLGVDGGYTQADVQEMARVLTGVGINLQPVDAPPPKLPPALAGQWVRQGAFEFNPARHDRNPKTLLGQPLHAMGLAEVNEALDRLARAPATARHVSRKLATYFVADDPPPALVERMTQTFQRTDGDIAAVMRTLLSSPEFTASLGRKFRDPLQYAVGAVRLAYGDRVITDTGPLLGWVSRLGQAPYAHETPDGYPLRQQDWASAGQMSARFDVARAVGANGAVLLRTEARAPLEKPPYPAMAQSPLVRQLEPTLGVATRQTLAKAASPQDWNTYLLASPERMYR
ncbi:DUF1800 domain-containing protein [uncultured Pseudacidovorax sp.]|uniref:DUF1800 domain-containing protein n=1 Tax=uncultured Pseudacidovorax sp. TaxID=679313 RepID=UPI0025DDF9E3|nr:DUF1800 domain-containing protein [uncultured Pseudacidovorax sp.]